MDLKENNDTNNKCHRIYFFRQLFSCSAVILNFFIFGVYAGAPTVIIPQMRKETNVTDATPEMISWLSSISAYSAIPWAIIWPMITYRFGRKIALVLISLNVLVGNIIFYCSTCVMELIISQATLGMFVGSTLPITVTVMSEYTSPKYRGIILTSNGATLFWGIWVSNAIGTFFHWRNIGILVFVCGIYNLVSSFFRCESPYWLATKGRFDECTYVHRWLKGVDENTEKELQKLILSQQQILNIKGGLKENKVNNSIINIYNIIRYKGFYKPLMYGLLPICLYNLSGKVACTIYAIDIIKRITQSEKMAYDGMLILDAVTVIGMYLGCALSKVVARRKQLLLFSSLGVAFLYILSIYLYVIKLNVIPGNNYVTLCILMGFSISISCGPIILATSCSAELAPLQYRSYFVCALGLISDTIFAITIKISPFVFIRCGAHGAFLFHAVSASILLCLIYKYLPETKDKTIQEIQEQITVDSRKSDPVNLELIPLKKPDH